jgi:pyrimidine-nucleoside phosphorylase
MVATAEAAGTRTVALLTDMGQPLGRAAGNWIELVECIELLRGQRAPESEDVRELSLNLAAWMIHLGGKAPSLEASHQLAEAALMDGSALAVFYKMVDAHGGDISVFDDRSASHKPGATHVLPSWETGYIVDMDTTAIGWAVQRTGAGREKAGEPVDAHAGIVFHAKRGDYVEEGQALITIYASTPARLAEPSALLKRAVRFSKDSPQRAPMALIQQVFTQENAAAYLGDAVKVRKTNSNSDLLTSSL